LSVHPGPALRTKKSALTRASLIDATERLICEHGLSNLTTQKVARACGVAEGTIYRHFASREELVVTTLRERLPGEFAAPIDALVRSAGKREIEQNLRDFIAAVAPIFSVIAPTAGMLAADPALAARNADALRADGAGPSRTVDQLAAYFREEQRLGRIPSDADPRTAASMLFGFCFYRSLMIHLFADDPTRLSDDELPRALAAMLGRAVSAAAPPPGKLIRPSL
jgi:AcrR family transcriptional regulator